MIRRLSSACTLLRRGAPVGTPHCVAMRRMATAPGSDKVVVTASLNGVLTDPAKFDIPVTPDEMATAAEEVRCSHPT